MRYCPKLAIIIVCIIVAGGCKKSQNLQFCEGVSPEGKPVECGTEFTTGDLTLVFGAENPFAGESVMLKIYRVSGMKKEMIQKETVKVKAGEKSLNHTISLYNRGMYSVDIEENEAVIASAMVSVVEMAP